MSSNVIDERIVEMGFDNKNFETNVKTSMSTIEKLKSSLDFSGISSSMNRNLSSIDTSVLARGIGKAAEKFTVLEIAAITAISNITNRIVDMGLQLVKSLSVDNISVGWEKFSEKTKSVGTIISQGYSMGEVETQLEKLAWYTDETSYSFSDMVNNIGKFTASGQNLTDSVDAMMGIANWAALSGQNAEVASRSMYQLAQALGSGSVRMQDWKSIQNANMDTTEFRKNALEAAVAAGTLQKTIVNGEDKYITTGGDMFGIGQFTEYLTEGNWFTSKVLMDTLGKYSSAVDDLYGKVQSGEAANATEALEKFGSEFDSFGVKAFKSAQEARTFRDAINAIKEAVGSSWTSIFEKIFGNYEEATVFWSDLSVALYDVFMSSLSSVNQVLKLWNNSEGRNDLFANTETETGAFWNLFNAITAIIDLVKKSWNTIFPLSEMEAEEEQIVDISNKLKAFTQKLQDMTATMFLSEESSTKLSNVLQGLFSILKFVGKLVGALWTGIQPIVSIVKNLLVSLFNIMASAGSKFTNFVKTTNLFVMIGNKLSSILQNLFRWFRLLNTSFGITSDGALVLESLFEKSGGTAENFSVILSGVKSALEIVKDVFSEIYSVLKTYLWPILENIFFVAGRKIIQFGGYIVKVMAKFAKAVSEFSIYAKETNLFQNGMAKLVTFIQSIPSRLAFLMPFILKVKQVIISVFAFIKKLPEIISTVFKSISGSSIGDVFLRIWEKLKTSFLFIKDILSQYSSIDTDGVEKVNTSLAEKFAPLTALLKGIGSLFAGVWSVIKVIVPIIGQALTWIGNVIGKLGEKIGEVFSGKNSIFNISDLFDVAFWGALIGYAYWVLGSLFDLQYAFASMIQGFVDILDSKAMLQYAEALKNLSLAVLILVVALVLLASIDQDKLVSATAVLTAIMAALMGFMVIMKKMYTVTEGIGAKSIATAISLNVAASAMTEMAASVLIMALAVKLLSTINQDQMEKALVGLISIVALLTASAVVISKNISQVQRGATGLISLALAALLLVSPLKILGSMPIEDMKQGLIGIALLMAMLLVFQTVSSKLKGLTKVSVGLTSFSIALLAVTASISIIGGLSWGSILKTITLLSVMAVGLVALCNFFSAIDYKKFIRSLTLFGSAMIVLSVGLAAFGIAARIIGGISLAGILKTILVLSALGVGLVAICNFFNTINYKKFIKSLTLFGSAMVALSVGLAAFGIATRIMGGIDILSMLKAILSLATLLGIMFIMSKNSDKISKKMVLKMAAFGVALIPLSVGLITFAAAMKALGTVKWSDIGMAIATIALVLIGTSLLSGVLGLVSPLMAAFGAALVIFSAGLIAFAAAMKILGAIKWTDIGKGILVMVVSFAALGFAAALLKPYIPAILGMAVAFMLFGVAAILLSTALAALIVTLGTFGSVLASILISISEAVIQAGPAIAEALAVMLTMAIEVIMSSMDSIFALADSLISNVLQLLGNRGPEIATTLVTLLDALLEALAVKFPGIAKNLVVMLVALIGEITNQISLIVEQVVNLISGIIDALKVSLPGIITKLGELLVIIVDSAVAVLNESIPKLVDAGFELVIGLLNGMAKVINRKAPLLKDAMANLAVAMWNGLTTWGSGDSPIVKFAEDIKKDLASKWQTFKSAGSDIMANIKSGIETGWTAVKTWFEGVGDKIAAFFNWDTIKNIGANIMIGIYEGIMQGWNDLCAAVEELAQQLPQWIKDILGIRSPSKVFAEIGGFIDAGLAQGITDNAKGVRNSAEELGGEAINGIDRSGLAGAIQKISDLISNGIDDELVIRPVMDLSEIQNGTNTINGMMKNVNGYSISGSNEIAEKAYRSMKSKDIASESIGKVKTSEVTSATVGETGNINNVFNITGSNPKEIAEKVSEIIQQQIDRRHAKWAR